MPQMAPLMWAYLYFYFLLALLFVLVMGHFIKPYQKTSASFGSQPQPQSSWKL